MLAMNRPRVWLGTLAVLLPALLAAPASAAGLLLQPALASDELFRGISQNNSLTASLRVDGRIASRGYFGGRVLNQRSLGRVQGDLYLGATRGFDLFDLIPVSVDAGLAASVYGGSSRLLGIEDPEYFEAYGSLVVGPVRVGASFAPDYYGTGGAAGRLSAQLKWPLPMAGLGFAAVAGWNAGAGVERYTASRRDRGSGRRYADYALSLTQALPEDFSAFLLAGGASIAIDGSRSPTVLVGLRWLYGLGSTGR